MGLGHSFGIGTVIQVLAHFLGLGIGSWVFMNDDLERAFGRLEEAFDDALEHVREQGLQPTDEQLFGRDVWLSSQANMLREGIEDESSLADIERELMACPDVTEPGHVSSGAEADVDQGPMDESFEFVHDRSSGFSTRRREEEDFASVVAGLPEPLLVQLENVGFLDPLALNTMRDQGLDDVRATLAMVLNISADEVSEDDVRSMARLIRLSEIASTRRIASLAKLSQEELFSRLPTPIDLERRAAWEAAMKAEVNSHVRSRPTRWPIPGVVGCLLAI